MFENASEQEESSSINKSISLVNKMAKTKQQRTESINYAAIQFEKVFGYKPDIWELSTFIGYKYPA